MFVVVLCSSLVCALGRVTVCSPASPDWRAESCMSNCARARVTQNQQPSHQGHASRGGSSSTQGVPNLFYLFDFISVCSCSVGPKARLQARWCRARSPVDAPNAAGRRISPTSREGRGERTPRSSDPPPGAEAGATTITTVRETTERIRVCSLFLAGAAPLRSDLLPACGQPPECSRRCCCDSPRPAAAMGLLVSSLWRRLFTYREFKICLVGLDNAGKTTILFQL